MPDRERHPVFMHCIDLEHARPHVVNGVPEWSDPDFIGAYRWLRDRVGFWPVWLAWARPPDVAMTGYDAQFRRRSADEELADRVLFMWHLPPHPRLVFSHHGYWHIVLNSFHGERQHSPVTSGPERWVLAPARTRERRRQLACRRHSSVQAVVPDLDLAAADRIWCRNLMARRTLIERGFPPQRVEVRRVPVCG